jgi:short subunit dehydrogenase-like uncharacterized protein
VRYKTHYVDITGETPWAKNLIDCYHEQAAADGTRIIPFCGFDSVPSDLGVYLVVRHLQKTLGAACKDMKAYFQARGGLNGGTLASVINLHESGQWFRMQDPFILNPPEASTDENNDISHKHERMRYDADIGAWIGPFFMGPVNTRVVRRSAALYDLWHKGYGRRFTYQEYLRYDKPFARAKAYGYTAALAVASEAIKRPATRRLLTPLLPKPGSGPSQRSMDEGWFSCEIRAVAENGRKARGLVHDRGDPANRVTAKCVCESALSLALNEDALPGGLRRGGILTPATGLGGVLADRLHEAGMVIEVAVH